MLAISHLLILIFFLNNLSSFNFINLIDIKNIVCIALFTNFNYYLIFRYLKFYKILQRNNEKEIDSLPWEQTFERFLLSHPASKEDCDLFVDVLIFLQLYLNVAKKGERI